MLGEAAQRLRIPTRPGCPAARCGSQLPTAMYPHRAAEKRKLDGWGAKNDLLPVELRATFFGIMRFG